MKIDYLWHSEFLLSIKNDKNETIKILSDSWLSDYVVGDLMGRNPSFLLDYDLLWDIDAIFLSHSHTDHIDPYTLVNLYKNLSKKPFLLLPETLLFLKPLFEKYLDNPKIIVLRNKEEISLKWIKIRWFIFENIYTTNEDDVMWLFVSNEEEIVFTEVDLIPPETAEAYDFLYKIFTQKKYKTVLYLATRNELEWNLKLLDLDIKDRKTFVKNYVQTRKEEIEYDYIKYEEWYVEYADLTTIPNFCKIFIWQWISFPTSLNPDLLKLRTMTFLELVEMEKIIARDYNKTYLINYFKPGFCYTFLNAKIIEEKETIFLKDFKYYNPKIDLNFDIKRTYYKTALNYEKRDIERQKTIILDQINHKMLPYYIWSSEINLKNLILNSKNHNYVIKVKYGTSSNYENIYYVFDFSKTKFEIVDQEKDDYNEDYWANDLEDFYDGRQELYSNFLHTLWKDKTYLLWTMMWANFLNNDILYKKFEMHFLLALEWKNSRDFVQHYYNNL